MPSQQDIENYIRQNAGMPIQQGAAQASDAVESGMNQAGQAAMAMKQAALQKLAGPQAPPPPPPQTPPVPNVLPNDPNMSPADQQSRMNAMIAAPLSGGTDLTLDGAQAQRQKMLDMYNAASAEKAAGAQDPDMSGYSDVPKPNAARQFPHIQKKMKTGQPVTTEDIRATMKGPQEVTPELEKKLGYGADDDDEEQR